MREVFVFYIMGFELINFGLFIRGWVGMVFLLLRVDLLVWY